MGLRTLLEVARRTKLRLDPRLDAYRSPWWPTVDGPLRIGIVGAGISGLLTAKLLADLGFQVTVLEARSSPGGRMLSLAPDGSGTGIETFEAGAARICDQHQHVLYWLKRFGLMLAPFYPCTGRLVRLGAGGRQIGRDVTRLSSHTVHHLVTGHLPWDAQFLENSRSLVSGAMTKPNWFRVVGGVGQLADALAEELQDSVRYDAPVKQIIADESMISIRYQGTAEEKFHRVVLTAPLATYREIQFVPRLSETRRRLVVNCTSQPSIRAFVTCGTGWQGDNRLNGWGCTEDGVEIWCHAAHGSPLELVTVYCQGKCATHLVAEDKNSREIELTELLDNAFPGMRSRVRSVDSYCWNDNRWARGAQTAWRPDQSEIAILQRPESALHFAGESTCEDGWINGAIASAYRVVGEISRWAKHEPGPAVSRIHEPTDRPHSHR